MSTDNFVRRLVDEGAQKPMPHLWTQFAAWMGGSVAWLAVLILHTGWRPDLASRLHSPSFVAELALLLATGIASALAALALARPDDYQRSWLRFVPFGLLAAWAVSAHLDMEPMTPSALIQAMNERHFDCIACILTYCVPPGLIMFFTIRHGAPIRSAWAGGMTAGSVTAFAYLLMRVTEPADNPFHLLIWHALPVLAVCLAGILAGRLFLRWRADPGR